MKNVNRQLCKIDITYTCWTGINRIHVHVSGMEIKKEFEQGNLAWCIKYKTDDSTELDNIHGEIDVEVLEPEKLEYPVNFGVRSEDEYIELSENSSEAEYLSELKGTFRFDTIESDNISTKEEDSDEKKHSEVWFSDSGELGENHQCIFVPKEVVKLCIELSENQISNDKLRDKLSQEYELESKPVAYIDLRRKSRYCTEFSTHVGLLDKLYELTQTNNQERFDFTDDTFDFIKNRVIHAQGGDQAYPSESVSDLENKIEICSSKSNLPDISGKNELIGIYLIEETNELVDNGKFAKAREQISDAIDSFEETNSNETLPAKLKKSAIVGLEEESKCNFREAAKQYSSAANQAINDRSKNAYNAWSKVAKAKHQLNNGDIDTAKQTVDEIKYKNSQIYLIDLKKMTVLFDLYYDYKQNESSDPNEVFNEVNINRHEVPSTDSIIQYNVDYSAAFSMLITKQRHRQLGIDSGIADDSLTIIRDAITPKGISKNQTNSTESNLEQGGNLGNKDSTDQQSDDDFERNYTETKRAQRDIQFQKKVKEAYDQSCAVCGSQRKTPDGRPEVEAAHIRPVSEDGRDTVTNGIALCKLHHWAFDNGWISIDSNYSMLVQDSPEVSGYDDFIKYQGELIDLPDSENKYPDRQYLEFHRQEHNLKIE